MAATAQVGTTSRKKLCSCMKTQVRDARMHRMHWAWNHTISGQMESLDSLGLLMES